MAERTRSDDDTPVVDLVELEGEPTWRGDVLFDREAEQPRRPRRLPTTFTASIVAIAIVGLIVQRVLRRF